MSILMLACNPNLNQEQFEKLSTKMLDDKIDLIETATKRMKELPEHLRLQYAINIMPILVMF